MSVPFGNPPRRDVRGKLGYAFTPAPRHLLRDVREHRLTAAQYLVLAVLYERADPELLAERDETPELTLRMIATGVGSDEPDGTLAKRVRRLRDSGYFHYRIDRRAGRRAFYVFRLDPDAEAVSEQCPSEIQPACPSDDVPGTRTATPDSQRPSPAVSEYRDPPSGPPVSEKHGDLSECPRPANPHEQAAYGHSAEEACPSVSDVSERTNFSCTETYKDEESALDVARARETEDRFLTALAETEPPENELRELIERARQAALAAEEREHEAARERTLAFADELPPDERDLLLELVEQLDAVLIEDEA